MINKDNHIFVKTKIVVSNVLSDSYGDVITCDDAFLAFATIPKEVTDRLFFPKEENSLIGKPVFQDYKSDDISDVLGVVTESNIHDDGSVEALIVFDKDKYEKLEKDINKCSMSVGYWADTRDQTYTPYGVNLTYKK